MADFEQQLGALLSNPALMQQLSAMAGAMGMGAAAPQNPTPPPQNSPLPFDPQTLLSIRQMMQSTRLEPRQQELLHALGAYLPGDRIQRLERAMQAAKLASMASNLNPQGR